MFEGDESKKVFVVKQLEKEMKEDLVECLRGNANVFAWSLDDMPGIHPDIICHKLNIFLGTKLVKQKKGTLY